MSDIPETTPRLVLRAAEAFGSGEAISDDGVSLSFDGLRDSMLEIARALTASGVRPGDRVVVWAPNSHYWVRVMYGIHAAGAVCVPINTRFRGSEARELVQRTEAAVAFVDGGFLGFDYVGALTDVPDGDEVGLEARRLLRTVVDFAPGATERPADGETPEVIGWAGFLARAEATPLEQAMETALAVAPDDLSDIIFTSGTTGRAKGVKLHHGPAIGLYIDYGEIWGHRPGDRYLVSLPFFHGGGEKAGLLVSLIHGVTVVPMAVFDIVAWMRLIERERVTIVNGPPTVIYALLDHPDRASYDLSSLRLCATGAAVVPVAMVERAIEELPFEHFITAYGLTECYGTATMCRHGDSAEVIAHSNGRALPGIEVRVVDPEGRDCPPGVAGEVIIRGRSITSGYWDTPEQTADAIRDGWLYSGDVGSLDEQGNLTISDRIKDLFMVGGFNVSPAEIEQLLARHPDISEVSVVGVPDERLGEVARAFVIRQPGSTVTEDDVMAWCRERIANFKVPRSVVFLDAFPRTASGKVIKGELRSLVTSA